MVTLMVMMLVIGILALIAASILWHRFRTLAIIALVVGIIFLAALVIWIFSYTPNDDHFTHVHLTVYEYLIYVWPVLLYLAWKWRQRHVVRAIIALVVGIIVAVIYFIWVIVVLTT
jgi:hypothetical protein